MKTTPTEMDEIKTARSPAPLIPEVEERWSPRDFADRPVDDETLRAILEAARWAPSSYNEQPWRFLVARRDDDEEFRRMLECLTEFNREWAASAPVLMLTVARLRFTETGKENRHAFHDVGLAMGTLLAQATAMDVHVHQMAGIHPERARETYRVPDEFEVVAGVALGYLGEVERDDPEPRTRRELRKTVFQGEWGDPAPFTRP